METDLLFCKYEIIQHIKISQAEKLQSVEAHFSHFLYIIYSMRDCTESFVAL